MKQELRQLADRIENESYPLTNEDTTYLEQIVTLADLGNFEDDGDGGMLTLALDAAEALGVAKNELDRLETVWYRREAARRGEKHWNVRVDNGNHYIAYWEFHEWSRGYVTEAEAQAEADRLNKRAQTEQDPHPHDFSHSGLGIGGINNDQSMPVIPSLAAMERIEQLEANDVICRRCGASKNFDGAMFTTGGGDICDDCF